MHLIVVRRDLTGFQHLHPEMAADGTWSTRVRLADAGSYRVFADFAHDGEADDARDRPARRRRRRPASRCPRPRRPRAATAATTCASTRRRARRARRPSCGSRSRGTAAGRHRALPRRRRPPRRAARGRPGLPARAPRPATPPARDRLRGDVPDRGPLPPVPAVQARGPRPDRRVHAGGRGDEHARARRAADHRHDLRVVREPDRAQLNELDGVTATVNYATEKATVDFDAGGGRARSSWSTRSRRPATRPRCPPAEPRPARRDEADETAPLRAAPDRLARCWRCRCC